MHKVPNLLTRARLFRQKNRIMHQKAWVRCSKLGIISPQKLTQFWYFGSAAAARCKTYSERASVTSRVIWKIQKCKINCGTHKMSDRDNSFVMVMACLCQQKIPELISHPARTISSLYPWDNSVFLHMVTVVKLSSSQTHLDIYFSVECYLIMWRIKWAKHWRGLLAPHFSPSIEHAHSPS